MKVITTWYYSLNDEKRGMLKGGLFIIFFYVTLGIWGSIQASERHHHNVTNIMESKGTALAIAGSQCHFDLNTQGLQGCAGFGKYDGSSSSVIGIGKRIDNMLINGTIGREDGHSGVGLGLNFKF